MDIDKKHILKSSGDGDSKTLRPRDPRDICIHQLQERIIQLENINYHLRRTANMQKII